MGIYERLTASTGFDWDDGNRDKNWLLHGVTNEESEAAFGSDFAVARADERHSGEEERFHLLARLREGRHLLVVFTFRGTKIRVISARDMDRKERRDYEHAIQAAQADPEV